MDYRVEERRTKILEFIDARFQITGRIMLNTFCTAVSAVRISGRYNMSTDKRAAIDVALCIMRVWNNHTFVRQLTTVQVHPRDVLCDAIYIDYWITSTTEQIKEWTMLAEGGPLGKQYMAAALRARAGESIRATDEISPQLSEYITFTRMGRYVREWDWATALVDFATKKCKEKAFARRKATDAEEDITFLGATMYWGSENWDATLFPHNEVLPSSDDEESSSSSDDEESSSSSSEDEMEKEKEKEASPQKKRTKKVNFFGAPFFTGRSKHKKEIEKEREKRKKDRDILIF